MLKKRIKTHVVGFDDALDGGIPEGHIILLEGTAGTFKSSVAYSILFNNAKKEKMTSIYITLEQSKNSLLSQMTGLGMKSEIVGDRLGVLDLGIIRKKIAVLEEKGNWLELFKTHIENLKKNLGINLLVIDSLNLIDIMAKFKDRRTEMFLLFEWLKELDVTTFLISEMTPEFTRPTGYDEDFLADGIIQLLLHKVGDIEVQRRIRCIKMREVKHITGYFVLLFEEGKFHVTQTLGE